MDMVSWYWYPSENLFRDEDGEIVYDFYRIISPSRFLKLRNTRGVEYIQKGTIMYELVFCFDDEDINYEEDGNYEQLCNW